MSQTDDIARLAAILVRLHQPPSPISAALLRRQGNTTLSELGKAAGVKGETVQSWEDGRSLPSTQQGLSWLSLLHERAGWRANAGEAAK